MLASGGWPVWIRVGWPMSDWVVISSSPTHVGQRRSLFSSTRWYGASAAGTKSSRVRAWHNDQAATVEVPSESR